MEAVDQSLIADAEAQKHSCQAVCAPTVAVDGLADLLLEQQQHGREGLGRPLLVGPGSHVGVDVDRCAVTVEDMPSLRVACGS